MKGISLTIETIVIIILALVALAALLAFFFLIFLPGQEDLENKAKQSQWCVEYTSIDPDCNEYDLVDSMNDEITGNLDDACTALGFGSGSCTDAACISDCCMQWCK